MYIHTRITQHQIDQFDSPLSLILTVVFYLKLLIKTHRSANLISKAEIHELNSPD